MMELPCPTLLPSNIERSIPSLRGVARKERYYSLSSSALVGFLAIVFVDCGLDIWIIEINQSIRRHSKMYELLSRIK